MRATGRWCLVAAFLMMTPIANAEDVGSMLFTAGTVMTDANTNEWAWLQWMATDHSLIKNRPMDIYWKAGGATSTNTFVFQGRSLQVTDPRTISPLLSRGEMLGDNLTNLETAVNSLYAGAVPDPSLTLAEKIAALIMGSQDDDARYNNLVFMGRAHPGIAMAIGHGAAIRIPSSGLSTLEVRDHSTSEVIGRVILEAGAPMVLPAPGPLYRVDEASPMGNLNIRLGWEIPDALKRVSLLQFGYNLYRVTQYSAEKWWGPTPAPTTTELLDAVEQYESAKRVNRMPIVIDGAGATTNSWYAIDDNDGFSDGGTPFVDGTNYYYFLTALDLLGRDGKVSDGLMTFPCDRMAPPVPHGLEALAISDYIGGVHTQWMEIAWVHDTNDTDTARYYVYRHPSIANMQSNAVYALTNRISEAIVPKPTDTVVRYEDHTLSTNDWGITYWYTVRAEDDARAGHNLSGNSSPAYGVLRDWSGPATATGGVINIQVLEATCVFQQAYEATIPGNNNVEMRCSRPDPDSFIKWAEFGWWPTSNPGTNDITLERVHFADGATTVSANYFFDSERDGSQIYAFCRVGTSDGLISDWANKDVKVPASNPPSPAQGVLFSSAAVYRMVPTEGGPDGPGPHHWGDGATISNLVISIPPIAGAETVRVYRRINHGRRTLIHQGQMSEVFGAVVEDYTGGSLHGVHLCYYFQVFDQHGNAGPMQKIGCIDAAPRADLPVPLLSPIDSTGQATNAPGMEMTWFCTTPGVDRFELAVAVSDGEPPELFSTYGYERMGGPTNTMTVVVDFETNTIQAAFYRTGRIGTTFGSADSPAFLLDSDIELNREYTILVRAIGTIGTEGEWSNAESFNWSMVPTDGPEVPWPARELPNIQTNTFHANLEAVFLADSIYSNLGGKEHVGIRIGEIPPEVNVEVTKDQIQLDNVYDPIDFLYQNAEATNQTVMSCVLYRYQVTNALYHTVGGDVTQVSPLMETIAYGKTPNTTIFDPFIVITRKLGSTTPWGIYLIDTQPVVRNNRYQYLILRLDDDTKEIDRIIPVGPIDIP